MIKRFNQLITESTENRKVLYHGSPYVFKEFNDTMTFFSVNPKFAIDYSEQKSQEQSLDREANLYEVEVNPGVKIFDINKKEDENKIRKMLPDQVEFSYNNFGFTAKEDKEEFILNMKGFYTNKPVEDAVGKEVGEEIDIQIAMSQYDTYVIHSKDDEYVYAYMKKTLTRRFENLLKDGRYGDGKELVKFVEDYAKKEHGESWLSDTMLQIYYYTFFGKDLYNIGIPSEEYQKKFDQLYQELNDKIISDLVKRGLSKFNITERIDPLSDTWRYYENHTVLDSIGKLGYDGYVAKESNEPTYAIFNPKKSVNIIEYRIPDWREFKTWEEYRDFLNYDKNLYEFFDQNRDYLRYHDRFQIYKNWRNNVSIEDTIKEIKNKRIMKEGIKTFEKFSEVNFSVIHGKQWDPHKTINAKEGRYPYVIEGGVWTLKENPTHSDYTHNKVIYANEEEIEELNEKRSIMLEAKREYEEIYEQYRRKDMPYKFQ